MKYSTACLLFLSAMLPAGAGSLPSNSESRRTLALLEAAPAVNPDALKLALRAVDCAGRGAAATRTDVLALLDYSRPSTEPRLWVFDLEGNRLLFEELVAHGKNSGGNIPERFSNIPGSLMSSMGVFRTAETYYGKHGYSLRLEGLEEGVNDRSRERAIVMHAAGYVDGRLAQRLGRIGRSFGCPAVRPAVSRELIDTVRGGALLFAYYPDEEWLRNSGFLACEISAD